MKSKYLIILSLLLLCISINAIAATDINNTVTDDILNQQADNNSDLIDETLTVEPSSNEDIISGSSNLNSEDITYTVMYVGQNVSDDGGNGSYENPFSSLKLACDNVTEGDNVTINMFNGTYYVGSQLNFKSGNLIINGIGNVIIKNELTTNVIQAISLSYPNIANLTINNVVFDQSGVSGLQVARKFYPVYADAGATNVNLVVFNNCSFIGGTYAQLSGSRQFNLKFVNSIFNGYGVVQNPLFVDNFYNGKSASSNNIRFVSFENCSLINIKYSWLTKGIVDNKNVSMDGIWFGQNNIPDYLIIPQVFNHTNGKKISGLTYEIPVLRYAIFSVSESYLGNNQYEIIGKLCWNGTNDTVGDSLRPMTVTLSSTTGDIIANAVLENGTFKTIYTSHSPENKVTATLDYETIDLNFTNIDIQLNAPSIKYGENQNVTISLPQAVNATVTVTVNNKTYEIILNNADSITCTIPDVLPVGTHEITAIFADVENHIYGSNSTNITVSKITEYTFDVTQPSDVKVGDIKIITVTLPTDATGNITITIGEKVFEANVVGNITNIEVSGFIEGNNTVSVVYSGDDKYEGNSTEFIIAVQKAEISVDNVTLNVDVVKGTTIPSFNIVLPSDATGNLTVTINGKNYTNELVNGSATVNIPALNPGKYDVFITYSGDSKYNPITTNTTFSISKPVLTAKNFQMLYTSGAKYTVHVTLDGKAVSGKTVTFTINGKKTTANTDKNGYASVKINLPPKSKAYTLTATYLGVKITNKVTVKSIVVAKNINVKKSAKQLKIKVTLKKVNKKYLNGKKLTLKFKGKTYKAKTNKKGVATFTIKKNVLKKLKAGKKYSYKVTYGKDVVNKKITVKK